VSHILQSSLLAYTKDHNSAGYASEVVMGVACRRSCRRSIWNNICMYT
jgi:hypothetical protein